MKTLWSSLIQPHLDYCCQLWCPCDQQSISKLESLLRHFTAKISGCEGQNYWERLKSLNILSQERRRERSRIILIWKILQGYVDGYSLEHSNSDRRGRTIVVPSYPARAAAPVRNAKESSLRVHGAKIFNVMPKYLRDAQCSVSSFKRQLDEWLMNIPDQPTIPDCQRAAKTNSLVDQVAFATNNE